MSLSGSDLDSNHPLRGPGADPTRDRRRDLIEATVDGIAEHGLSQLTLTKVASRAGLTGAMINFHFTSKEALLKATLQSLYDEYEAAVARALEDAGEDPGEALLALVAMHFDPVLSDPRKVAVWSAFWGESRARADYMALCGGRDAAQDQKIRALCREVIERDGYEGLVPEAIAAGLDGILEASWQGFLVDDSAAVRRQWEQTCTDFLSSVFPRSFPRDAVVDSVSGRPDAAPAEGRHFLPPWTYQSAEFTELEKEHLFRRDWILVGHASEAPTPGDYMTFEAVDERALIVRGKDGALRAFHNICRHRASKVLAERQGHCKGVMTCPFHGWSYGLDGRLRGIPAAKTFGDLDKNSLGLKPLDLEIWQGFVFIRFGGSGPSVADQFAPGAVELAPYRLEDLVPCGDYWEYETDLDWKTVHDVDNEGYHVPIAHPGLHRLVGRSYYDEVLTDTLGRSWSVLRDEVSPNWAEGLYQRLLPEVEHLPESHRRAWLYYAMMPNLSIAFYPDLVDFFQAFPIAPGRSLVRGRSYALPSQDRALRAARYLNDRINKRVTEEDRDIAHWSASGMQSSGFEGAVLSDLEVGVRALHDHIRKAIPVARQDRAPALGTVAAVNQRLAE